MRLRTATPLGVAVAAAAVFSGAGVGLATPPESGSTASPVRHARAVAAESAFFVALNRDRTRRADALVELRHAYSADPSDPGTLLLLGMAHLWIVAEAEAGTPSLEHLVLAEHFLARAAERRPDDARIASWLQSARWGIAALEHDPAASAAARAALIAVCRDDPCFHSVALGILSFDHPADSPEFREGLEGMRRAAACAETNPSASNAPRWPHNVEGFMLALADYELKAGERRRAEVTLMALTNRETYVGWPYRHVAEERLERLAERARRYANGDPADDPAYILSPGSGVSCVVCHRAAE